MTLLFDSTGLQIQGLTEIREETREELQAKPAFGTDVKTGPDSRVGQIIDVNAEREAIIQERLDEVNEQFNPQAAEGTQLENVTSITGTTRELATFSTVRLNIVGGIGATYPAGNRFRITGQTTNWALDRELILDGAGLGNELASADVAGPEEALAGTITEIVDAVGGHVSVTNVLAAEEGKAQQSDSALRVAREQQLNFGGSARDDAIAARLEALADVDAAAVISNRGLTPNAKGQPGKSFRAIVTPSTVDKARVAVSIFETMPSGIRPEGLEVVNVTNSQGQTTVVRFDFAALLEIHTRIEFIKNLSFPSTGIADITNAVRDFDNDLSIGDDVLPDDMGTFIRARVPGIDHLFIFIKIGADPGTTPGVNDSPIDIDVDEIAFFDANISVAEFVPPP